MATNPRFEITSSSPDNAAYGYPNPHRSHYSAGSGAPSLERPSSFRESHEGSGRGGTSGPAFPNAGNSIMHGELPPLSQVLSLEQIATGDSKSSKQPELRRATAAALALVGEGHGGLQLKPIEQQSPEELKRIRSSLLENSAKAKERSRALSEAVTKLDRFRTSILTRKRARLEAQAHERTLISVSGERPVPTLNTTINPSKASFCASPSHATMGEGSMPKLEDKTKALVPNKRVRTSMLDVRVEGRANMSSFQRLSGLAERDREPLKAVGSLGGLPDDKDRLAAPGGEAWEKTKTKGRRSTTKSDCVLTTAASGAPDIDREHKWGLQHRSNTENRPRSTEGHSFRSGPVHGVMSIHKSATRHESENAGISGEKEGRFIITDKERPTPSLKSGVKLAPHKDEGILVSPTTIAKAKAARAPRSGTGVPVIPTLSHAPRPSSNEVWERTPSATGVTPTRAQLPVGPSNRKRPAPTRSSSPPVTQWVGQRPQKMSRVARRMNVAPPMGPPGAVSARDESISNAEVAPVREPTPTGARSNPSTSPVAGLVKRVASTAALSQIKSKPDRVASPAAGIESDDSEGADFKSKEKWRKHADSEGRFAPVNQKMAPLFSPGKKSRVGPKEEGGDGMRRQGRSGRAIIAVRDSSNVALIKKGDASANAKQLRSARPGVDKMEKTVDVKPGRPPNKKGGTGALTRPRRPATSTGGEVSGESDDDREELAAAVQAAINASAAACSSLFWKEIEPFFAYLTPDARNSLKIQVKARELEDEELLPNLTSDRKAEKAQNTPHDSAVAGRASDLSNGTLDVNGGTVSKVSSSKIDHALDGRKAGLRGGWPVGKELPLSQRLLAALIIEGDMEDDSREDRSQLEPQCYVGDGLSHDLSDSEQAGIEKDQDSESEVETRKVTIGKLNGRAKSSPYDVSHTSNGHRHWDSESELLNSPVKSELRKEEERQCSDMNGSNNWEGRYQSLTLDERIALELQSLGLYPDQGELPTSKDDQLAEELQRSQLELKELVHVNKERLSSLEKVVSNAGVIEDRERERLAMIKMLENAFNKRLGPRGGHLGVSGSKNAASKAGRAAAVAIAKRSLARWKHYVETEEACFNEAGLREILFCISSKEGDTKALPNMGEVRVGINTVGLTLTGSSELKLAASAGTRWICRAFGTHKVDKDSCESDRLAVSAPWERTGDKDDVWCVRSKEREVLLEEVGGSGSVGSVLCGTKGKRSERERDAGTGKGSGRQGLSAMKDRKPKTKLRQKTAPLLKTVNGLLGKPSELPEKSDARIKQENTGMGLGDREAQAHGEGTIDLSHLQIPGMDDLVGNGDLGGQGQDLGSWLDFDDPGLPDAGGDFMGLDVPMDDLADLSMLM